MTEWDYTAVPIWSDEPRSALRTGCGHFVLLAPAPSVVTAVASETTAVVLAALLRRLGVVWLAGADRATRVLLASYPVTAVCSTVGVRGIYRARAAGHSATHPCNTCHLGNRAFRTRVSSPLEGRLNLMVWVLAQKKKRNGTTTLSNPNPPTTHRLRLGGPMIERCLPPLRVGVFYMRNTKWIVSVWQWPHRRPPWCVRGAREFCVTCDNGSN